MEPRRNSGIATRVGSKAERVLITLGRFSTLTLLGLLVVRVAFWT